MSEEHKGLEEKLCGLAEVLAEQLTEILKDPQERSAEMFRQARELLKDNGVQLGKSKKGKRLEAALLDPEVEPDTPPVRPQLVKGKEGQVYKYG